MLRLTAQPAKPIPSVMDIALMARAKAHCLHHVTLDLTVLMAVALTLILALQTPICALNTLNARMAELKEIATRTYITPATL